VCHLPKIVQQQDLQQQALQSAAVNTMLQHSSSDLACVRPLVVSVESIPALCMCIPSFVSDSMRGLVHVVVLSLQVPCWFKVLL
jgi:hypothetical protein